MLYQLSYLGIPVEMSARRPFLDRPAGWLRRKRVGYSTQFPPVQRFGGDLSAVPESPAIQGLERGKRRFAGTPAME